MSPLLIKHYDAIRMARQVVDLQEGIDGGSVFEKSYRDHRNRILRERGLSIARALLDAIEEPEKPK